ncbi:PREDICTED: uncharacterized protein LOC105455506 isoform X2 [Wasmannia auropunctata]|uniref:uncharacterized protein LOC105455506 isoform X2 n=1 Tax=Wasmannia auropunctata TaxID=64793 RepID=UPI0005EFE72E|nr:PREDICTED: uncharacterized protein LOC105455506 isoform X2 [Wasmannia auropunctata]
MERGNPSKPVTLLSKQSVICRNLLPMPLNPRLTPTGKISHAKTRVYTQRYRKEWEQMSDFKGWLTSVPFQQTRAYCLYCQKNLHAHRLSLLKHTCTMKHQRAALSYKLEEKQTQKTDPDAPEVGLMEEVETLDDSSQTELGEDTEDDIEYVVETLETDEESMEFEDIKEKIQEDIEQEEEKEMDSSQSNKDSTSVIKKIKLLPEQKCQDPLAHAMAHVHNEYLEEEIGDQENVQMEMVIESTESNDDASVDLPMDDNVEKTSKSNENEKSLEDGKVNLIVTSSLPVLNTAYQTNISTSTAPTKNTISFVPIAPKTQKTITLMCGNKQFTLTGGTFQPGTQYVLTKLKGKPALMLNDQKKVNVAVNEPENKTKEDSTVSDTNQPPTVPGTSQQPIVNQQSTGGKLLTKMTAGKPTMKHTSTTSKKLRVSTYVVDTVKGIPIGGLQVSLYKLMDGKWTFLNENNTNAEGQCGDLLEKVNGTIGRYKLHYDVDKYFTMKKIDTMFPFIEIIFDVKNPNTHHHIPLLLSPFGYTTYRGT